MATRRSAFHGDDRCWAVADWTERPSGFDERRHHEQAASGFVGAGDEGAHGAQAEVGMDGEGVSTEGGVRPEVRLRPHPGHCPRRANRCRAPG